MSSQGRQANSRAPTNQSRTGGWPSQAHPPTIQGTTAFCPCQVTSVGLLVGRALEPADPGTRDTSPMLAAPCSGTAPGRDLRDVKCGVSERMRRRVVEVQLVACLLYTSPSP